MLKERHHHDVHPERRKSILLRLRTVLPIFKTTATIDTYVYNALQSSTPIGMTSAATFFQSVACCITILLANAIVKKIDEDSAII